MKGIQCLMILLVVVSLCEGTEEEYCCDYAVQFARQLWNFGHQSIIQKCPRIGDVSRNLNEELIEEMIVDCGNNMTCINEVNQMHSTTNNEILASKSTCIQQSKLLIGETFAEVVEPKILQACQKGSGEVKTVLKNLSNDIQSIVDNVETAVVSSVQKNQRKASKKKKNSNNKNNGGMYHLKHQLSALTNSIKSVSRGMSHSLADIAEHVC